MNRLSLALFLLAIIAIGGGAAWYLIDSHNDAVAPYATQATTTPSVSEGQAIYTNGTYGFSIFYPESAIVEHGFDDGQYLQGKWRMNARGDAVGTAIVAIVPYTIQNETTYPRRYSAFVRIGASQDAKEVEQCEKADTAVGEIELPDVVIGGHTWKAFSFKDAAMMQYQEGVSYRTIHEDHCIALEQVRMGSSYRDVPSDADVNEEVLTAAYTNLDSIVTTFSFAR